MTADRLSSKTPLLSGEDSLPLEFEQKITVNLLFNVMVAILSSFCFGWNIGVVNQPQDTIIKCTDEQNGPFPPCIPMNAVEWGLAVGAFAVGGLFGGLFGGVLCKKYGRKSTLYYNNIFFFAGGLLVALSLNIPMFAIGRFVVGLGSGVATAAVPMFIGEISPDSYRGTLGTLHQLAVVIGLLSSHVLGLFLSGIPQWRFLMGLTLVPPVFQLILLPLCVESPRYSISKMQRDDAKSALARLRGSNNVSAEFDSLIMNADRDAASGSLTILSLLASKTLRKTLWIAIICQMAQQLSGINGVMQFSSAIFDSIFPGKSKMITVVVSLVNLFMTLVSLFLMDRAGRRLLLLLSQSGMVILSFLIVVSSLYQINYLTAGSVIAFVAIFAIGLGPIPWLIMPEIFPTNAVAPASSLSSMLNWICNFLVTLIFPSLLETLKSWTFLPFGIISFILMVLVYFLLPETKGKSVDEISRKLQQ